MRWCSGPAPINIAVKLITTYHQAKPAVRLTGGRPNALMRSILVTGTSTGIGEAIALRLDRLGHRVYAGVRREVDAEHLAERASKRLVPVMIDVTDQGQIELAAKQIADGADGLDGLVNNAAIANAGPLEFLPIEEWRRQFEVNVIGQVAVTKAMLPMIRKTQGRVVFVGSIEGRSATMLMGPYNASKFAIEAIGESLRQELHLWKIPVSVIEPGVIKTTAWDKTRNAAVRTEAEMPAEAQALYRRHFQAFREFLDKHDHGAVSPERAAVAVERALFDRRPRGRYVVGSDARFLAAMVRLLPDRPREALVRRYVGVPG